MVPVHLHLSELSGKPDKGISRFWGNPDLPCGTDFPSYTDENGEECPHVFLCQINLKELALYDKENLLPHEGILSFFAKIADYLGYYSGADCIGGSISAREDVKVLYFPDNESLEETVYAGKGPAVDSPSPLKMDFSTEPGLRPDDHAVFALPEHRPWENWDAPFEDWPILLQVDSFEGKDFGLNFMDVGVLDFIISPSDLERHVFDDVRAIVLSS